MARFRLRSGFTPELLVPVEIWMVDEKYDGPLMSGIATDSPYACALIVRGKIMESADQAGLDSQTDTALEDQATRKLFGAIPLTKAVIDGLLNLATNRTDLDEKQALFPAAPLARIRIPKEHHPRKYCDFTGVKSFRPQSVPVRRTCPPTPPKSRRRLSTANARHSE